MAQKIAHIWYKKWQLNCLFVYTNSLLIYMCIGSNLWNFWISLLFLFTISVYVYLNSVQFQQDWEKKDKISNKSSCEKDTKS